MSSSSSFEILFRFLIRTRCTGVLTPREVVWMGTQIAQALAFLHKNGLTHRDVAARNAS
jgi:serine/threonine protein kinase